MNILLADVLHWNEKKIICYRHHASGKIDKNVSRQKMNYECTVGWLKVGQSCQTVHPEDIGFIGQYAMSNQASEYTIFNTAK